MIVNTTNDVAGYRVVQHLGVVRGLTVRSRSIIGNIGAGIQSLFGGNISIYTDLAEKAREEAYELMVQHAASQATMGTAIDFWSEPIEAGDLVFMATHGDPNVINHVGIAVDATHWIHAPAPGDVVRLAPIPPKGILSSVRRLIP